MDRPKYGTVIAATAVMAGLYALYQYRARKRLYLMLNIPVPGTVGITGFFTRVRNFINRNTVQDRLWNYIESRSEEGNPESVLASFDDYCYNYEWTWTIGDEKAEILSKVVQEASPKTCLELGTFCGYSAVVIAHNMPSDGKIITVEANAKSAEVARKIINRAGFADKVTVINAYSEEVIPELKTKHNLESLDMVFLDHFSKHYARDLQSIEKTELLNSGSVVFADNIKKAGGPGFSQYIRNSGKYECRFYPANIEYIDAPDGMERGIYKGADV